VPPARWPTPEEGLLAGEVREVVAGALAELPASQRTVIALRAAVEAYVTGEPVPDTGARSA
jgi:DNA-directed RNA polymerase specialized sigma24 family protein